MLRILLSGLLLAVFGLLHAQTDGLATLKQRYVSAIMGDDPTTRPYLRLVAELEDEEVVSDRCVVELFQRAPVTKNAVAEILANQRADGSWADINYKDRTRSGWQPGQHSERMLMLAKYVRQTGDGAAARGLHRAIRFWAEARPECLNWWYNEIGVPRTMGQAFLLFEDSLTTDEHRAAVDILRRSRFGRTGQNKVWLAGNVLMRALLEGDTALVRQARDAICSEVTDGREEGIQPDFSFHQHGPQQQFGNYGLAYLSNMSLYADIFAHTPYALTAAQMKLLTDFLLEGYRWVVWRGEMDVNALNRQLFHNADRHKALSVLFAAVSLLKGCGEEDAPRIRRFIRDNFDTPATVNRFTGHKHFASSDLTLHRRPHWGASLRMASSRTIGVEFINEDCRRGFYMADGALYVYARGDEYHNIFPLWSWRRIPGTTTYDLPTPPPIDGGRRSRNHTPQVGGTTHGEGGISAMRLERDGVKARKAWIFTDRMVVCLGGGIETDSTAPLMTTIDQRHLRGRAWHDGAGRYFHDGTGYIVLRSDSIEMTDSIAAGSWSDFMGMYPRRTVTGPVFSLSLHHRRHRPADYLYIILPATTRRAVTRFKASGIRVLRNDNTAQALVVDGRCYVAAYAPCRISLPSGREAAIGQAGTYIVDARDGRQLAGDAFAD